MRVCLLILLSGFFSGCALFPSSPQHEDATSSQQSSAPIVQLVMSDSGTVAKVSSNFVVLAFPFSGVPGAGQQLNVYRTGKKVAELKVTGPQRDSNTVADIISGEVQVNDEVRND